MTLIALLPSLIVLLAILALRWNGLAAAGAAAATALVIALAGPFRPATQNLLLDGCLDAALLTLLVAATIVPGIAFVEATTRLKATAAISNLIDAPKLSQPQKAVLVTCGAGVLIESLTGMGVSLLVTVPILVRLYPRNHAIALALVGMSLMPWGALSLSALVGAKLAAIDIGPFAKLLWSLSGPVAIILPFLAILIVRGATVRDIITASLAAIALWAAIGAATAYLGIEIAGAAGGLAVIGIIIAQSGRSPALKAALCDVALRPYLTLVALVIAQKALLVSFPNLATSTAIDTGRVSFAPLASPGVALSLAVIIYAWRLFSHNLWSAVGRRAGRALATSALFLISARLLVASGAIDALARSVAGLGDRIALVATAGLGAVGGFVTGSAISANALFLPAAATTGANLGDRDLFAVLSNSTSGHTAMTSLPVIALLIAALPTREPGDEATALRIGASLAALYLVLVTLVALRLQ